MMPLSLSTLVLFILMCLPVPAVSDADTPDVAERFLQKHCFDCHFGVDAEAGLDLQELGSSLEDAAVMEKWVRVFDRVQGGEMPPPDVADVDVSDAKTFLNVTSAWLRDFQLRRVATHGRVGARRLTNLQLERTLHDLLGIDIPLAGRMTDEPRTAGFTTVAAGQPMSHFQVQQHLDVVDAALDEAFRRAMSRDDEWTRYLSAKDVARRNPRRRTREPEMIDGKAVVWSSRLIFYGRLPVTTARDDGWYRVRVRASSLNTPDNHGVWCTVRTGKCVSSAPLLAWAGAFEATAQPQEWTFEAWLPRGHMFEIRPGDSTLKNGRFAGGQVGAGEGTPQNLQGVAIHNLTLERIHKGPDNDAIRQRLFGQLPQQHGILISTAPVADAKQLIHRFAQQAFRRPVSHAELADYVAAVEQDLHDGVPLHEALRGGYRSILCSARFLYFYERPGPLDDHAVASRLSYLLWNSMPDQTLRRLADTGQLRDVSTLQREVNRMLADDRGRSFVRDFAAQWLDLSEIDFTEPDRRMFPKFDIIVQQSMLDETHAYLQEMLDRDLSVGHLIKSDFSFLNSRLARFYGINDVRGDEIRRVSVPPGSHRGGILTQGAILKVTANGTNTSPVIRGVWIAERLLGDHIPPPPEGVPAVEPDIRGATSIREQLAKHRSDDSCAACHRKIDPPGFALENFDPAGQWRESYYRQGERRSQKRLPIDPSYDLADGRHFDDVEQFQNLILQNPEVLARNVAEKLLTYGTGGPVTFADRVGVEQIVNSARGSGYGFRSLVSAVVTSSTFRSK